MTVRETNDPPASVEGGEISQRSWRLSSAAILIVGALLRLYYLTLVPLHHDEGVNGNFLVALVREGRYTYDPQNYHGPTLYYFSAIVPWLTRFFGGKAFGDKYGLTTFNIRFVTAAFGVATIGLALLLRKRLGTVGALSAAALLAISPGAVYLSRYFIHESLFVFFGLGIVVAALKYYDSGRAVYLILAAISAALMVATKETWIINGPVLLIALVSTDIFFSAREWKMPRISLGLGIGLPAGLLAGAVISAIVFVLLAALHVIFPSVLSITSILLRSMGLWRFMVVGAVGGAVIGLVIGMLHATRRFGGLTPIATIVLVAFTAFILVNVLFYSSFFSNYPKGVQDALQTLNLWSHRIHEHEHPWWQYGYWLVQEELPLLIAGGAGVLVAIWRASNRLAVFLGLWSFGLLGAYSLVGYKTPWISLNFIVPLALIGGYALDSFYHYLREFEQPRLFLVPVVLIVAICGYQMYSLNFVHYDDDRYVYVYAHTRREMLSMLAEIDSVAARMKTGKDIGVAVVSPDYWPLPWYFRDYKRVGYYSQTVPTSEPIVIGSMVQEEQLKLAYGDRYQLIKSGIDDGAYPLRPAVDLLLYVRKDVAK